MTKNRRRFIAGAAALCAAPWVARGATEQLLVRTSGGSFQAAQEKAIFQPFTRATGIKVVPVPLSTGKLREILETGRIPVDNPATHLELTMIHEAMVLEYAGPDLALVEWASAIKELLYLTLLVDLFVPLGIATTRAPGAILVAFLAWAGKVFMLAVAVTLAESTNAKLRLFRVPELLSASLGLAFLSLAIRFL